jgi:hypothetical protein
MAQGCPLATTLILKDTQDGFAGQTGTIWTTSFTIARQIGPKIADEHRKGQLTPEQQVQPRDVLAQIAIATLPEQFGIGSPVNARRITFSYASKVSVLTLAPFGRDHDLIPHSQGSDPAGQLLKLTRTLQEMIGE